MIEVGVEAPDFELSAVVDGTVDRVTLGDYRGEAVVVLVFYPGDFNPACENGSAGMGDLDLFTMQKDVAIVGISSDTVFSHAAFADAYDIHFPLASDLDGSVADAYGLRADAEDYLVERGVVVVDLDGVVTYTWHTEQVAEEPPVGAVRAAVDAVTSQRTATARYGVGHAHYVEGRRCFTSATGAFEEREWVIAKRDYDRATAEFEDAAEEFNTATRFAAADEVGAYFERAEEKARSLGQAAEWLAESAEAYSNGRGTDATSRRESATGPLESARAIPDPVDPEEFDPETHVLRDGAEGSEESTADSGFEFDVATAPDEDDAGADGVGGGSAAEVDSVDEADLAEIAAEIEEQSEQVQRHEDGATTEAAEAEDEEPETVAAADGDIDLELTDPSDGEDELVEPERASPEDESDESAAPADVN